MRSILLVVVTLVACASGLRVAPSRGYHVEIGIPLAAKIRETEERIKKPENERIIGGVVAPIGAYPHYGGLLIDLVSLPGQSVCGSSLVTPSRLLTAAHCWFDGVNQARQFTVILGSNFLYSGGVRVSTSSVVMHPQWAPQNLFNDIAAIYLPWSVSFTASIQPVTLPNFNDVSQTFVNQWANAVGFGAISDHSGAQTILSHVNLRVITVEECRSVYGAGWIFQSTLCTSGTGSVGVCGGDSGGPLTIQRSGQTVLIGVTSFAAHEACEWGYPSGFARVTSFLNFINQHLW